MKKQIFLASALLVALFFTACEQEALIDPMEDYTVLLENDAQPPQEAVDALQVLIDNDFKEINDRCNSYPEWGYITNLGVVSAPIACGRSLRLRAGSAGTGAKWFYYHVDQKQSPSSNYLMVTSPGGSAMKYTTYANWTTPIFSGANIPGGATQYCDFRAYIYVWDAPCGKWERLAYGTY